jgi:hypothetical protein
MFEDVLVRLRDTGARVVVTSGNHDSARRLGFGSGWSTAPASTCAPGPPRWPSRCCSPTRTGRSPSTGCPTWSRRRCATSCRPTRRTPTRRRPRGRRGWCAGRGLRARRPGGARRHPVGGAGARVGQRGRGQ